MPDKVKEMKDLFLVEAAKNNVLPIGAGLFIPILRPDLRVAPPYKEWNFVGPMTRMPEFCAPSIGNRPNVITMDVEIPANANGVLYALGGFSGGLAAYIKDNILCYEYNLFEIQRSRFRSSEKTPAGKATIEVTTDFPDFKPGAPAAITMKVNGRDSCAGHRSHHCSPLCSPQMTVSTLALTPALLCPLIISMKHRSPSTEPLERHRSSTCSRNNPRI